MSNSETIPDGKNQIAVPKLYVNEIRALLGDEPESNDLTPGTEFSDQMIARHLVAIIQDYNTTPPLLANLTLEALGSDSSTIRQLRGAVYEAAVGRCLRYSAIRKARNDMAYSAGSVTYNPNANWAAIARLGDQMLTEWDRRKKELKIAINVMGGYSVAHSDLASHVIMNNSGVIFVSGSTL